LRTIAAASGFRAVQSTPLVDGACRLVGVVSTHYPRPFAPSARDQLIVQRYADLVGRVLASRIGMVARDRPAQIASRPPP
jgi:GAF domain-containing protein